MPRRAIEVVSLRPGQRLCFEVDDIELSKKIPLLVPRDPYYRFRVRDPDGRITDYIWYQFTIQMIKPDIQITTPGRRDEEKIEALKERETRAAFLVLVHPDGDVMSRIRALKGRVLFKGVVVQGFPHFFRAMRMDDYFPMQEGN